MTNDESINIYCLENVTVLEICTPSITSGRGFFSLEFRFLQQEPSRKVHLLMFDDFLLEFWIPPTCVLSNELVESCWEFTDVRWFSSRSVLNKDLAEHHWVFPDIR
jgi:hypothetical protein